jgi:recombination protein RecA
MRDFSMLRACESFVAKNKLASPFCEAEFEIRYRIGADALSELLDLGLARGLTEKNGNHLVFAAGSTLGNGLAQTTQLVDR